MSKREGKTNGMLKRRGLKCVGGGLGGVLGGLVVACLAMDGALFL